MTTSTHALLRERRADVEILTLNRPEVANAVNPQMVQEMTVALDELEADPGLRVIILTGKGERAFCSGLDLKSFGTFEPKSIGARAGGFAGFARRDVAVPVIAAVNGAAVAGGFELVLACDLVVAAEHAFFGIPEAKRGLIAAGGGLVRLPERVPRACATELALTGEPITSARAYDLGLVNLVVPGPDLIEAALSLAGKIVANAPLSVRHSLKVIRSSAWTSEEDAWALSDAAGEVIFATRDAKEGAVAFAEHRPASWQGR
ncbi:MAG: enoyl-CoA hydratase-related protein [Acidimicrobiales bacterium]